MTTPLPKMTGQTGSYFATVAGWPPLAGRRIPCVHRYFLTGLDYHDPALGTRTLNAMNADYFDVMRREMRVVVTSDTVTRRNGCLTFKRRGYVAIYVVASMTVAANWFSLVLSPERIDVAAR